MSGENKSSKDRLAEFEQILNEYTQGIGINGIQYNAEVNDVLSLTREQLRGMHPEDCGELAFILSQYAVFIQKEQNRQRARVDWAEREISYLIALEQSKYYGGDTKYVKYDLLRATIIKGNSAAQALDNIVRHAKARHVELDKVSSNINLMSKALIELQQTKRYKK